jgi:hypothetical protein
MSARGALVVSYYDRSYGQDNTTGFSDITLSAQHARDGRDRRDRQDGFKHRRVTSASMPPPSQFAGQFIGDYAGLDVARGKAYPIWTDTRAVNEFLCLGPSTGTGDARRHQRAYPPNEGRGTAYSTTWNSTLLLALNRQDRPGRDRARGGSVLSVLKVSPTRQI